MDAAKLLAAWRRERRMDEAEQTVRPWTRRVYPRALLKTSVTFTSESNFYTGFTDSIGEGGVFVATHNVFPIGTQVGLELLLPDSGLPISVPAVVRWTREYNPSGDGDPGLGLQFSDLMPEHKTRIERFIKSRGTLFYD